jgi:hypothetical protein
MLHYDLTRRKRLQAVRAGAVELPRPAAGEIIWRLQEEARKQAPDASPTG